MAGARGAREESAIAIIKAATKNNGLQSLDIRGVPLGPQARQKIRKGSRGGRCCDAWPPACCDAPYVAFLQSYQ